MSSAALEVIRILDEAKNSPHIPLFLEQARRDGVLEQAYWFLRLKAETHYILLLLSAGPATPQYIYNIIKTYDGARSYESVKRHLNKLAKRGYLTHTGKSYTISPLYLYILKMFLDSCLTTQQKNKIYNYLSFQGELKGNSRGTLGDISTSKNNTLSNKKDNIKKGLTDVEKNALFIEKVIEKAKEIIGRELDPAEEAVLEILARHYRRTRSLWMDPQTLEDAFYGQGSSKYYRKGLMLSQVLQALDTLAAHRIAYKITERGRLKKIALYREFVKKT